MLAGNAHANLDYGALGRRRPRQTLVPVLFAGGLLVGFGSRWAGACTSGHGITGCSTRSTGSMVATLAFMVSGVAVTYAIHLLSGGAL